MFSSAREARLVGSARARLRRVSTLRRSMVRMDLACMMVFELEFEEDCGGVIE
jgi:hypothetical protein